MTNRRYLFAFLSALGFMAFLILIAPSKAPVKPASSQDRSVQDSDLSRIMPLLQPSTSPRK